MLTNSEIEILIDKLRKKYEDHASRFNPRWFDKNGFEERLQDALRNKINLEAFIMAEIAHFEMIRQRYENEKKKNEVSFSTKVDALIEELSAKIKKYPKIEFHPKAHFEIMHMYGACNQLLEVYFPILWLICNDRKKLYEFEQQLQFLGAQTTTRKAKRIEDHIRILTRPGIKYIDIEKDKNEYLKECAFLLHTIKEWLESMLPDYNLDTPVSFAKLYVHDLKRKQIIDIFRNDSQKQAISKVISFITGVIEDFRLHAFKQ